MDFNPFRSGATQTVQEKMDPVNKKELKGKHKDRKDKDIDNDGDVDGSDEYLHKRRKAISKADEGYYKDMEIKKQDKAMGAKPVPSKKKKEKVGESRIRTALKAALLEKENHSPNADKAEKMSDKIKGQGAKDMMAAADAEIAKGPDAHLNEPEIDKANFKKMTSNVPAKKMRANDNSKGETKVVPGGTPMKDPAAMKPEESVTKADDNQSGGFVKKESVNHSIAGAYASMYETEKNK